MENRLDPTHARPSIDQGPYLNVADGMVAAMGNERMDGSTEESIDHDQTNHIVSENNDLTGAVNPNFVSHAGQPSQDGADAKGSSIIARCLYQLSQHTNKSVWLLVYIAIISTWPVAGAALRFLFRRRSKGAYKGRPVK